MTEKKPAAQIEWAIQPPGPDGKWTAWVRATDMPAGGALSCRDALDLGGRLTEARHAADAAEKVANWLSGHNVAEDTVRELVLDVIGRNDREKLMQALSPLFGGKGIFS